MHVSRALIASLLVVALLGGAVAPVTAQEGDSTPTPGEDASTDEETIEELWKVYKESQTTTASETKIIRSIGPNTHVTDLQFDKSAGVAHITITTKTTIRLTFTDSSGIDASKTSGTFEQESLTVPRGTYTVVVPATVDRRGNQMVTVTGGAENIWLSNGDVGNPIFEGDARWFYLQVLFLATVIGVGAGAVLKAYFVVTGRNYEITREF